jgi:hypothetical protein
MFGILRPLCTSAGILKTSTDSGLWHITLCRWVNISQVSKDRSAFIYVVNQSKKSGKIPQFLSVDFSLQREEYSLLPK